MEAAIVNSPEANLEEPRLVLRRVVIEGLEPEGLPEPVWTRADPAGAWLHDVDLPEDLSTERR